MTNNEWKKNINNCINDMYDDHDVCNFIENVYQYENENDCVMVQSEIGMIPAVVLRKLLKFGYNNRVNVYVTTRNINGMKRLFVMLLV